MKTITELKLQDYLGPYKNWLDEEEEQGGYAHGTVRQRKYAVDEFVAYFNYHELTIDLEDFYGSTDKIREFFDQTPITQAKVTGVRLFLEYIIRQLPTREADRLDAIHDRIKRKKLIGSTGSHSRRQRKKTIEDKILSERELEAVLALATPFERLIITCMLDTGCRPGELAALTPADFNFDVSKDGIGATVKIKKTYSQGVGVQDHPKTDDSIRTVNLREETADNLQRFIADAGLGEEQLIFQNYRHVYDSIKEIFTFAWIKMDGGVTKFSPHWCRHNACTRLIRAGYPKEKVQQYMGHSSVTVTEIYEHFNEDEVMDIYA